MPCNHIPGDPERAEHDQEEEYAERLFFTSSVRHRFKYSECPANRPYAAGTRAEFTEKPALEHLLERDAVGGSAFRMADMHDAATAEAASLYEFEHGDVTRMRFDAQALAPVLTGNRLGGLQQIATQTLPAMTLGNRNTMQHGISRVA